MSYNPHNPKPVFDDDGNIINEPAPVFPILLLNIGEGDEGWDEGYRWRIDQLDEDYIYMADWDRVEHFVMREGLDIVSIEQMHAMREAGHTY